MSKYIGYNNDGKVTGFPAPHARLNNESRYVLALEGDTIMFFDEGTGVAKQLYSMSADGVRANIATGAWKRYARRPKWLNKKG